MGGTHARAFSKIEGVEVAVVSSLQLDKAQKLAHDIGGRATTDNMAIIATPQSTPSALPTHLHAELHSALLAATA